MGARAKQVSVSHTPENYNPSSVNAESHFTAIDSALGTAGIAQAYDISVFFAGAPSDGQTMARQIIPRDVTVNPANAGIAASVTAPTAETTYDILLDNGSTAVGSVTFEAGSNAAIIIWEGDEEIVAGSTLTIVAPTPADATHEDITFEIIGTITGQADVYDFGGSFEGMPASEEVVGSFYVPRDIQLDGNVLQMAVDTAPTANATFTVTTDDGGTAGPVEIGTVTFIAGAKIAFITVNQTFNTINNTINRNTVINIIAPTVVDLTLAEITFAFTSIQLFSFTSYDISFFYGDTFLADQIVYNTVINQTIIVNQTNTGGARAVTAATGNVTLDILVDGVARGTVFFAAGSVDGVIEWDVEHEFIIKVDAEIQFVAPSSADPTLAGVTLTLAAEETSEAEASIYTGLCAKSAYWLTLPSDIYVSIPSTTSTIEISNTANIRVGMAIRFVQNFQFFYGIVVSIVDNVSITIAGAPFSTSDDVTSLAVGDASRVIQVRYFIQGVYAAAANPILASVGGQFDLWAQSEAYLVTYSVQHGVDDSTSNPSVNLDIAGSTVSTANSNNGVQVSSGGWSDNPDVAINTSNYAVDFRQDLEVVVTVAGGTGDAEDLSVVATYVLR